MPRRAQHWTFALAMMVAHAQAGHASVRHHTVTSRPRLRSPSAQASHFLEAPSAFANAIVSFTARMLGRQVGDGECFALADQALSQAGAKSAADYSDLTPDGDYIWGKPIWATASRPGDILQFRNFRIVRRVTVTTTAPDGSVSLLQSQEVEERDHHTAVVTQNLGGALVIAEQNVEPLGRIVQRNTIEIATGTTWQTDTAAGTQTKTEIFVDGAVRAYRPQKSNATMADATRTGS